MVDGKKRCALDGTIPATNKGSTHVYYSFLWKWKDKPLITSDINLHSITQPQQCYQGGFKRVLQGIIETWNRF